MIQMTLARIVKVLEFIAMITQTSWIQNIVCHSYSSQLQCGFNADERQPWANYENNGN